MTSKTCKGCGTVKSLTAFHKDTGTKDKRVSKCKPCVQVYNKTYHAENKLSTEVIFDRNLRKRYGITATQYSKMLEEQSGVCKICSDIDIVPGRRLAVDHCHNSGIVRGLLCSSCNQALGLLKENLQTAKNLLNYIKETE